MFPAGMPQITKDYVLRQCSGFFESMAEYECSFCMKPLPPVAEHVVIVEEEEEPPLPTESPSHPGQKRTNTSPDLSAASTTPDSLPSAEKPDASSPSELDRFYKVKDKNKSKRRKKDQARPSPAQASPSQASPRLESPRQVSLPTPSRDGLKWRVGDHYTQHLNLR